LEVDRFDEDINNGGRGKAETGRDARRRAGWHREAGEGGRGRRQGKEEASGWSSCPEFYSGMLIQPQPKESEPFRQN